MDIQSMAPTLKNIIKKYLVHILNINESNTWDKHNYHQCTRFYESYFQRNIVQTLGRMLLGIKFLRIYNNYTFILCKLIDNYEQFYSLFLVWEVKFCNLTYIFWNHSIYLIWLYVIWYPRDSCSKWSSNIIGIGIK